MYVQCLLMYVHMCNKQERWYKNMHYTHTVNHTHKDLVSDLDLYQASKGPRSAFRSLAPLRALDSAWLSLLCLFECACPCGLQLYYST